MLQEQHGNATKLGGKAAGDYIIKGDFAVLTGSITLANGSGSQNIDYPEGFNQSNCVPIAAGTKYSTSLNRIVFGFNKASNLCVGASLNSGSITLSVGPFSGDVGASGTYNYQVVLMKIS